MNNDNIITNDRDESIGYYKDIMKLYQDLMKLAIDNQDFEELASLTEQVQDIMEHKDYEGLLILSENNGMGFTVNEYHA